MKFKSALVTAASGKVGGMVASRNKGGQYFRALAIPTNPNTAQQQAVRASMGNLAQRWRTLTDFQQLLWNVYAANVTVVDVLGDAINLSGFNMYLRSNIPRVTLSLPIVDNAPSIFDLGDVGTISMDTASAATQNFAFNFTDTDAWVDEDDSALLVYVSRPQNSSISYFKGPYRYAGQVDGDGTTPPTTPATISFPFGVAVGQKVFWRANVSRADGRLSQTFRGTAPVGA